MLVKVKPSTPIPAILPNNKFINEEMELDLNKKEIIRCMKFGSVYTMDGNLIDSIPYLSYLFLLETANKSKKEDIIKKEIVVEPVIAPEPVIDNQRIGRVPIMADFPTKEEIKVDDTIIENKLKVLSCSKDENNLIVLDIQYTGEKLESDMYGLFTLLAGCKASVEYKNGDAWNKISNKFASLSEVDNEDVFTFRISPKNTSDIKFRISIKEKNNELVKLEDVINQENL